MRMVNLKNSKNVISSASSTAIKSLLILFMLMSYGTMSAQCDGIDANESTDCITADLPMQDLYEALGGDAANTVVAMTFTHPGLCGGTNIPAIFEFAGPVFCGTLLTISAAPDPSYVDPGDLPAITCDEARTFDPNAYVGVITNGLSGNCEISGPVWQIAVPSFDACGGMITLTYTLDNAINCDRGEVIGSEIIVVEPAEEPTITLPLTLPTTLSCDALETFEADDATYTNSGIGVCEIAGDLTATVEKNCGIDELHVVYTIPSAVNCNRGDIVERVIIPIVDVMADMCPLACNGTVQVSLDENCQAVINPAIALSDDSGICGCIDCPYVVTILDVNGDEVTGLEMDVNGYPIITGDMLGSDYDVMISLPDNNSPCWGDLVVEDKLKPIVVCIPDVTVACYEDNDLVLDVPEVISLTADVSVDLDDTDVNMVTYALGTPTPLPSPVGIIRNIVVAFDITTNADDDVAVIQLIDNLGNTCNIDPDAFSGNYMTPDTATCSLLLNQSVSVVEWPLTLKVTLNGSNPDLDMVVVNSASVSFELESYFTNTESSVDNCSDVRVEITADVYDHDKCQEVGFEACATYRTIEYVAYDNSGNVSDACLFNVCYEKRTLSDLTLPASVELDCKDNPDLTALAGVSIEGFELDPVNNLCKFNIQYTDNGVPACSGTQLIRRNWTIVDWCTADLIQFEQVISIYDNEGPEVICSKEVDIYTNENFCTASFTVYPWDLTHETGPEKVEDACTALEDLTVVVEYLKANTLDPGDPSHVWNLASFDGNGGYYVNGLELGLNWVRFTYTDDCGNSTPCTWELNVIDSQAPHAVCDEYTTVTLQNNGWGRMLAFSLDDGSYDDCGDPLVYTAKRVVRTPCSSSPDYVAPSTDGDGFADHIDFCCADVGLELEVILKVTDSGGNYSTCTVIVEVQDKSLVTIDPVDPYVTVDCDDYDEDTMYPVGAAYPTAGNSCQDFDLMHEDSDGDDCGLGEITRSWFYLDASGTKVFIGLSQTINIVGNNLVVVYPGTQEIACDGIDDAPALLPTVNGTPVNEYEGCASLSWTFEDQPFYNVEGYCVKIIRTWFVIDHCIYEPNSNSLDGYYSDTQVIKVMSSAAPVITNCPADEWYNPTPGSCEATITVSGPDAEDACFGLPVDASRFSYVITDVNTGAVILEGNGNSATITVSPAEWLVTWTVEGPCGNTNTECSYIVDVVDEKAPTPYCHGGITTVVMDSVFSNGDPFIEIWASDFDLGSFDDCDNDLTFSFSPDVTDQFRRYNCDSLGVRTVRIYVTDDSNNSDYCETTISIQSNGDVCEGSGNRPQIAGKVETESAKDVQNVSMSLENMSSPTMAYQTTNDNGLYAFGDASWADDYHIAAEKNDDYLNGVSTLDIVMIQRHILGIQHLDSPYKAIAADVNNSETISAIDLIELRKLILGIYSEYPSNDSWRFVDAGQSFNDINQPWPFLEEIAIHELYEDMMSNDFIAVKVGDVNESVVLNVLDEGTEGRSNNTLHLGINHTQFEKGATVRFDISAAQASEILGMQYTLEFDESQLEFKGIESGVLTVDHTNVGQANGSLAISWNNSQVVALEKDAIIYTLIFTALDNADGSSIQLSNRIANAEAYDAGLRVTSITLERRTENEEGLALYQNKPNPFDAMTYIDFYLPKDGYATFEVYDIAGKVLGNTKAYYSKGLQTIAFSTEDINAGGILYYKISTDTETATRKMLLIK